LPPIEGERKLRSAAVERIGPDSSLSSIGVHRPSAAGNPASSEAGIASLEVRSLAPLGRLAEIVSREVRLFKRSADDLVEVVLTPDARTQISLRLQWREGQVEVMARCDQGDHQALNSHWPQLQAALAGQGVRLSHLAERVHSGLTSFFSNPDFAGSRRDDRGESQRSHAGPSPMTGAKEVKPAAATAIRHGARLRGLLESWA
jgi:hypothetical protein